jgi:hypothetical protein
MKRYSRRVGAAAVPVADTRAYDADEWGAC